MYTQAGALALINDAPMFMYYTSDYKIYATRLDATGNFVWPGNQVEISSTTASGGNGKMRYGFTPVGPNKCAGTWTEKRGSNYNGYAQGISIGGLTGVVVATQGGVPALITTDQGTLQLVATVYPSTANQAVTWSIVQGTGGASIDASGLVTGISNGTVYGVATSVQDTTVSGSILITLTNQSAVAPTVVTLPASDFTSNTAIINGTVNANNFSADVIFDYGTSVFYGQTVPGNPPTVTGTSTTSVSADLSGLTPNTLYHFRIRATSAAGTSNGVGLTFLTGGVGVNDKNPPTFDIYPVPNDGLFNISFSSDPELSCKLEIYNSLGVRVYGAKTITISRNRVEQVDLRALPSGVYTIILRTTDSNVVRNVMINR
jgi:hypothetical protein